MTDDMSRYQAGFDMQAYYDDVLMKANAALAANWSKFQLGFHGRTPPKDLDAYTEAWWAKASATLDAFDIAVCGQANPSEKSMLGVARAKTRAAYVAKLNSMKEFKENRTPK